VIVHRDDDDVTPTGSPAQASVIDRETPASQQKQPHVRNIFIS